MFLCCLLKSFIRQQLFYMSSETCVGWKEISPGVVSICISVQNLLPEFHLSSQMLCDKRDVCLCITLLDHIARTRNCICKYNFKVPGKTHQALEWQGCFQDAWIMCVIHLVIKFCQVCCCIFDVENCSSSPLPPVCLPLSGLCWIVSEAHIRCMWQKLGEAASCLGYLWEKSTVNKEYKKLHGKENAS